MSKAYSSQQAAVLVPYDQRTTGVARNGVGITMALSTRVRTRPHRTVMLLGFALLVVFGMLWHHTGEASAYETQMNDNFSGAALLPGGAGSTHEFTYGATKQAGDPATAGSHSVWFKWTAAVTGTAKFNTRGSECSYNGTTGALTVGFHVYTGTTLANLVLKSSSLTFSSVAGTKYFIAVDTSCSGFNGAPHLWLNWNGPANDLRTAAQVLSGTTGRISGTNRGASVTADEPVGFAASSEATVWYTLTPAAAATASFNTTTTDYDAGINVYQWDLVQQKLIPAYGDADTGGSHSAQVIMPVTAGTQYFIMVTANAAYDPILNVAVEGD